MKKVLDFFTSKWNSIFTKKAEKIVPIEPLIKSSTQPVFSNIIFEELDNTAIKTKKRTYKKSANKEKVEKKIKKK